MSSKILLGAVALVVLIIVLIVLSFFIGQTLVDIFVILAALFSLLAFAALAYAGLQAVALVKEVRGEVQTLVGTAQETLAEVQGTARFVNQNVVAPVNQAAAYVNTARQTVKAAGDTVRAFTEPLFKR